MFSPHKQECLDRFYEVLREQYEELFRTSAEYQYAASVTTPAALARKMTLGLDAGTASEDGEGIRKTCKILQIPHTYKGIREFLNQPSLVPA